MQSWPSTASRKADADSNKSSPVGSDRFSCRHRHGLNQLLGSDFDKKPSDSTFRLLLSQLDVSASEVLLRQRMVFSSAVAEGLNTLIRDDKTLRGPIDETNSGAAKY